MSKRAAVRGLVVGGILGLGAGAWAATETNFFQRTPEAPAVVVVGFHSVGAATTLPTALELPKDLETPETSSEALGNEGPFTPVESDIATVLAGAAAGAILFGGLGLIGIERIANGISQIQTVGGE